LANQQLKRIEVKLARLTKAQAEYLGVPVEGPYKPEHYRY
jgi:adenosylhomocysteinase